MLDQSKLTLWSAHCSPTVSSLESHASGHQGWARHAFHGLGADLCLARGAQGQHLTSDLNALILTDVSCGFCLPATSNSGRTTRHSRNGVGTGLPPSRGLQAGAERRGWCLDHSLVSRTGGRRPREADSRLRKRADLSAQRPNVNPGDVKGPEHRCRCGWRASRST